MTFGNRVSAAIEEAKTSAAEVARKAGVKPATISDWVRDVTQPANVKAMPLIKAAAYLNVNPAWLLTGKGERSPVAAAVFTVNAPAPPPYSNWPFSPVAPDDYYSLLTDADRRDVANIVQGLVMARRNDSTKSTGTSG